MEPDIKPLPGYLFYDFRHAVCLVDGDGRHLPLNEASVALARELLVEYGEARGGSPTSTDPFVATWDFGTRTGYCLEFRGKPTEPVRRTRLYASPCVGNEILRGREELYAVPAVCPDAEES